MKKIFIAALYLLCITVIQCINAHNSDMRKHNPTYEHARTLTALNTLFAAATLSNSLLTCGGPCSFTENPALILPASLGVLCAFFAWRKAFSSRNTSAALFLLVYNYLLLLVHANLLARYSFS